MSKTADIEAAVLIWLDNGPLTVDEICDRFQQALPGEQLTWLGIAMHKPEAGGRIVFPGCGCSSHEGDCRTEVAR